MAEKLVTKNDLLNKLRAYRTTPDDDVILYKQKIKNALLLNPCLLYALDDKELESELFDKMETSIGNGMKIPSNMNLLVNGIDILEVILLFVHFYLFQIHRQRLNVMCVIK